MQTPRTNSPLPVSGQRQPLGQSAGDVQDLDCSGCVPEGLVASSSFVAPPSSTLVAQAASSTKNTAADVTRELLIAPQNLNGPEPAVSSTSRRRFSSSNVSSAAARSKRRRNRDRPSNLRAARTFRLEPYTLVARACGLEGATRASDSKRPVPPRGRLATRRRGCGHRSLPRTGSCQQARRASVETWPWARTWRHRSRRYSRILCRRP